jgi:hypothetical protein
MRVERRAALLAHLQAAQERADQLAQQAGRLRLDLALLKAELQQINRSSTPGSRRMRRTPRKLAIG